ncbi:hypothetical protein GCK32_009172, partial [Trichostrongylus colubriformis]
MDDGDSVMTGDENVPPQEIKDSVEALMRHSENHRAEGESLFDWSSICEELEVAVNGHDSTDAGRRSGAVLTSAAEKGHLQYQCLDDCFANTTLGDIEGLNLPGAYGKRPFGDVWTAWKAASIFIRKELTVPQKIRLFKDRAVSLDVEALTRVLKLAYSVCTDWTEFLCTTSTISKHEAIDGNCIIDFYKPAFSDLKKDLADDSRAAKKPKQGPTGFAAPETALLMEKDGPKGGLITKVVTSFSTLRDTLMEWTTFGTWIIVFPMENKGKIEIFQEIVKIVKDHVEDGGHVVTAWTPITATNMAKWTSMVKLWKTLDWIFVKLGGNQVITTASCSLVNDKVFVEAGSPEGTSQFYNAYLGVAAAKQLYCAICKKATKFQLPTLEQSSRTTTRRRGGMWEKDANLERP